jgi:hypothetical protein
MKAQIKIFQFWKFSKSLELEFFDSNFFLKAENMGYQKKSNNHPTQVQTSVGQLLET